MIRADNQLWELYRPRDFTSFSLAMRGLGVRQWEGGGKQWEGRVRVHSRISSYRWECGDLTFPYFQTPTQPERCLGLPGPVGLTVYTSGGCL